MNEVSTAALGLAIQANTPCVLKGDPGNGKTSIINAMSKALGWPFGCFVGTCRLPEDIGGYPVVDLVNNRVRLLPVGDCFSELIAAGKGVLLINEIGSTVPAMQAALMRVVQERYAGDVKLPDGISIVLDMNPTDTAINANEIGAPVANRMIHLDWVTDPKVVIQGFLDEFPEPVFPRVPEGWRNEIRGVRTLVASFLQTFPQHVHAVPKEESKRCEAWPSPRSWYGLAIPALAAARAANASNEVQTLLLGGAVGNSVAIEFLSWLRKMDLPNPLDLLKDPKKFKMYDRQDKNFAVLNSVVAAAIGNLTPDYWVAAWTILAECAKQGHVDVAAAACRSLARNRNGKLPSVTKMLEPFAPVLQAAGL
jgi:hypothetical protein